MKFDHFTDLVDQNHCIIQLDIEVEMLKFKCLIEIELDYRKGIKIKNNVSENDWDYISIHDLNYIIYSYEESKSVILIRRILPIIQNAIIMFRDTYPCNDYESFYCQLLDDDFKYSFEGFELVNSGDCTDLTLENLRI